MTIIYHPELVQELENAPSQSALATIETANFALIFVPGGVEKVIERIKREAREQAATLDISTETNRKAIRSLGFKVARSKTAIDEAGKKLNEAKRRDIDAVDADRRIARAELDALKAEVLKPVDDYEARLETVRTANEAAIATMEVLAMNLDGLSSDEIRERFRSMPKFEFSLEFQAKAKRVTDEVTARLQQAHAVAKEHEAAAEKERQRIADLAEETRVREHQTRITDIRRFGDVSDDASYPPSSIYYRLKIDQLDRHPERDWQEFAEEADAAYRETRTALVTAMDEAVAAETAAQEERERQAAAEATRLAQETAALQAKETAKAAQAALDAAAERERQATARAERDRAMAEARRLEGHANALATLRKHAARLTSPPDRAVVEMRQQALAESYDREWEEFADQAATEMKASAASLEQQLQEALAAEETARQVAVTAREEAAKIMTEAAEREAKAKTDAAVEAERQRAAKVRAEEDADQAKRNEAADRLAADMKHQAKIHREIMADIENAMEASPLSEGSAKAVVVALAKGQIRHTKISYAEE